MDTLSSSENSVQKQSIEQKFEERKKLQRPHSAKPRTQGFEASNKQPTQQQHKQGKNLFYRRDSKTPKQRKFRDNESLLQEIQQLKMQQNQVKQENMVCKTKIQIYQKELLKQEQLIEKLALQCQEEQYVPAQQLRKSMHFEKSVKIQLNELKQVIKQKDDEIEQYKRNIKITRFQEMELELKAHLDECTRLRHLLQDQIRFPQKQEQKQENQKLMQSIEVQQQLINTLKKENTEMNNKIKIIKDEKLILKKKLAKQSLQQPQTRESSISKEKYMKAKKKMKQLKNDHIYFIQQISEKDKQILEMDKMLKDKVNQVQKTDEIIQEKEKQIIAILNQKENEKTEKYEISNQKEKQINEI